jgi:CheY-like chemotaxis protein
METILVIDDDLYMRDILRDLLSLDQYTVVAAENGVEGLQKYREIKPGLVLTDLVMPEKDGLSFIQEIKEEYPEAKIIAVSGSSDMNLISDVVSANVNRILTKPFDIDELLEAVAELMDTNTESPQTFSHHHYPRA